MREKKRRKHDPRAKTLGGEGPLAEACIAYIYTYINLYIYIKEIFGKYEFI